MVSLEEIWRCVPSHYRDKLEVDKWSFLTQQEHPFLGRPFYQLHPCHTADLMKQVPGDSSQFERFVECLSIFRI
ncbi:hypothetical protein KUTeg_016459 [Tegillarca granosa]|uniref:Ubiquitin-like-conjugating enzyme ATG10 n=1 Tax=Tegillarca granosa TaxID=220873 RepID=A0ABQ9EKX5_TEGGR|nr:hypothetical protein KUTeg_016459 [Tegillarca granosa]